MLDQNKDSLMDLKRNLKLNGLDYYSIPLIIQYNKRDLPDILDVADLDSALNERKVATFQASAYRGQGVVETLKAVTLTVFKHVRDGGLAGLNGSPSSAPGAAQPAMKPAMTSGLPRPAQTAPQGSLPRPPSQSGVPAPLGLTPQSVSARTPMAQGAPSSTAQMPVVTGALQNQVAQLVSNAAEGDAPMPSRDAIGLQEFKNLAVLHHQLTERVAQLEKE